MSWLGDKRGRDVMEDPVECSVCGLKDFRSCNCPWHLPFSEWVGNVREKLLAAVPNTGPVEGS